MTLYNARSRRLPSARSFVHGVRAVTLLELLVVMAIIALLVSILVGALGKLRASTRNFECKNKLKTVGFDFLQFAEDYSHPYRGESERLGHSGFYVNDFQERVYKISEFWKAPSGTIESYRPPEQPMICPSGPQDLQRQAGLRCDAYAVWPPQNVSTAFNMRLYKASVKIAGRSVLKDVRLSSRILSHPDVPLVFDVDGQAAANRSVLPYYATPPAGDTGVYGSGTFWFPALRHQGRLNAGFVGGYVLSSPTPDRQSGWGWTYQPAPE